MRTMLLLTSAVVLTAGLVSGCLPNPSVGAVAPPDPGVKLVAPPAEMVGKWRHEVSDGKATRTSVYEFAKDGSATVEVKLNSPDLNLMDRVKRAIIKVEKDQVTWIDLSHTGVDDVEDVLPPENRRATTFQIELKGDELHLREVNDKGKIVPDSLKSRVLKRIKE